jgi:hypothetical protein
MAKKKYPTKSSLLNLPGFTVLSYFVFQGMRYMTLGERAFKLGLTLAFTLPFLWAGLQPIFALGLGHAVNFLGNGQLPVLMRYVLSDPALTKSDVESAIDKLEKTAPAFGIKEVLFYGSFCRHQMKSTSDLDLRFFHGRGVMPSLGAYIYASYIRLWANLHFVPIDVYCFSDPCFLNKMRKDEHPALLLFSASMAERFPRAAKVRATLACNEGLA